MAELALDSDRKGILNADGGRIGVVIVVGVVADGGSTTVGYTEGEESPAADDLRELSSSCGGNGEGSLWLVSAEIDDSARGELGSVSERISAVVGGSEREVGALELGASKSGGGFSS